MKAWFEGLGSREQMMLVSGAVVLGLVLIYALLWSPLADGYQTMKTRVSVQRDTVSWMEQNAQLLLQLKRASSPGVKGLGGKSLLSMTDSTARSSGLGPALKRVEPEGSSSVRVWLEGASFDLVTKWLGSVSTTHGIEIDSASIERVEEEAGKVNARLTLKAPAS